MSSTIGSIPKRFGMTKARHRRRRTPMSPKGLEPRGQPDMGDAVRLPFEGSAGLQRFHDVGATDRIQCALGFEAPARAQHVLVRRQTRFRARTLAAGTRAMHESS
ncbi:MAG: hypothetical protein H6834_00625 [Planctomycetes bacterium]|nr:hypothetical protein [Planctomycetota bacterium]